MDLKGVAAIVTGGASGLGEAAVRELAAAGARVVIVDLNAERGAALAREVGGAFAHTDVCDEDSVAAAVRTATDSGAPLRVAVNCAGILVAQRTVGLDGRPHELWPYRKVIDVNLVGTFNVLRIAAAAIAQVEPIDDEGRGVIVNTASITATEGQAGQVAYSASKAGVAGMTVPAARDLGLFGVRVCAIAPGVFETPLVDMMAGEMREALGKNVVFPRRLGRPAEYARLVRAICEIGYLNGEVIRLDGALRMPAD